jgi:hypothetical protein
MITRYDWRVRLRFALEDAWLMWHARMACWRSKIALLRFALVYLAATQPAAPLVLLFACVWPLLWWWLTAQP